MEIPNLKKLYLCTLLIISIICGSCFQSSGGDSGSGSDSESESEIKCKDGGLTTSTDCTESNVKV